MGSYVSDAHAVVDDTEVAIPFQPPAALDGRLGIAVTAIQGATETFVAAAELFIAVDKCEAMLVGAEELPPDLVKEIAAKIGPQFGLFGRRFSLKTCMKLFGIHISQFPGSASADQKFVAAVRQSVFLGEAVARSSCKNRADITPVEMLQLHDWTVLSRVRHLCQARLIDTSNPADAVLRNVLESIASSGLRFLGCRAEVCDRAKAETVAKTIRKLCRSVRKAALNFVAQHGAQKNKVLHKYCVIGLDQDESDARRQLLTGEARAEPDARLEPHILDRIEFRNSDDKEIDTRIQVTVSRSKDGDAIREAAGTRTKYAAAIPDGELMPESHRRNISYQVAALRAAAAGGKRDRVKIFDFSMRACDRSPVIRRALRKALSGNSRRLLLRLCPRAISVDDSPEMKLMQFKCEHYFPPAWEEGWTRGEPGEESEDEGEEEGEGDPLVQELSELIEVNTTFSSYSQLRRAFSEIGKRHDVENN